MKNLLISTALLLGLATPALAQVNFVPQVGVINAVVKQNTYTATAVKLVPAASATDIMCLNGSTSKNIHLREVPISGRAGTAINTEVLVNLNHSLDTAGTPTIVNVSPLAAAVDIAITDTGVGIYDVVISNFQGPQGVANVQVTPYIISTMASVTARSYSSGNLAITIKVQSDAGAATDSSSDVCVEAF